MKIESGVLCMPVGLIVPTVIEIVLAPSNHFSPATTLEQVQVWIIKALDEYLCL
jgi:hypothetical protein